MNTMPKPGDKKAAFVGLVAGAIVIMATCYALVLWTNSLFEGHGTQGGATPAATQGH